MHMAAPIWLLGMLSVIGYHVRQYRSLVANVPLGIPPGEGEWSREWRDVLKDVSVSSNVRYSLAI
jgi:hypothetical protein